MRTIQRTISSALIISSLLLAPVFAFADHDNERGRSDVRATPATPATPALTSSSRRGEDGDNRRSGNSASSTVRTSNSGPGSVNSGRGNGNDRHDDDDCVVSTLPQTATSSGMFSSRRGDDDDCPVVATKTPDVTSPIITAIASVAGVVSATVTWTTNEPSSSTVFFSTSAPVDVNASTTRSVTSASFVTIHSIALTGLATSTTYHFVARSIDPSGNVATSGESSFTTLAPTAVNAPVLSDITTAAGTTTATVSFDTDVPAIGTVFYGTLNPFSFINALGNPAELTNHVFSLIGLTANTTYFYVVLASNAVGSAVSSLFTFTTAALPDVTPPTLSSIVATSTAPASATFTWTTNEPATSKVFFSTTTPVDLTSTSTPFVVNSTLVTAHSVPVLNLATSTTYHFVVQSTDAAGNSATSSDIQLLIP